jgi:hypothetical protein
MEIPRKYKERINTVEQASFISFILACMDGCSKKITTKDFHKRSFKLKLN